MKRILEYMVIGFGVVCFTSCQEYNLVEDMAQMGYKGGNAYFELPSTNVVAGDSADFMVQYWFEDDQYQELAIYYDVKKHMRFSLTYPGNGYSFFLDSVEVAREFQKILDVKHSKDNYSSNYRAYVVEGKIPVSYTLSEFVIPKSYSFPQSGYDANFPADFKMRFLKGLYPTLGRAELKNLYVIKYKLIDESTFEGYYDRVFDENSGKDIFILKEEFKQTMFDHLVSIPLEKLIYGSDLKYELYYKRYYSLTTRFKVVNGNGIEVFSESKVLTVK